MTAWVLVLALTMGDPKYPQTMAPVTQAGRAYRKEADCLLAQLDFEASFPIDKPKKRGAPITLVGSACVQVKEKR